MYVMKNFVYLSHTADAGFEAFGKNLNETFVNSGVAMLNMLTHVSKIKPKKVQKFKKVATNLESLLYDFLDEIIFLLETKNFIVGKIQKLSISEENSKFTLTCEFLGDNYKNYEMFTHIKAPTYHKMLISKTKSGYKIRVFVDV